MKVLLLSALYAPHLSSALLIAVVSSLAGFV
jgi:hypothetical protein